MRSTRGLVPRADVTRLPWARPRCRSGRRLGVGRGGGRFTAVAFVAGLVLLIAGCTAEFHRRQADRTAYDIIAEKQAAALGRTEPFRIAPPAETLRRRLLLDQQLPSAAAASRHSRDVEPIRQWPDADYLKQPPADDGLARSFETGAGLRVSLTDALQIAAHESREYQARKEQVFQTALQLDLERDAFRRTWKGVVDGLYQAELEREVALDDKGHTDRQTVGGLEYGSVLELSQRFRSGLTFTGQLGLDLVSLLTQDRLFSRGVFADVTISMPLLRGSGEFVVTEPLTQAERNVVYALYEFERFKRQFAVSVASEYLAVLRQLDAVHNAADNYRRLIASTRRARRLADAGRLPEIQVDQSRQDELRARNQWVSATESYQRQLDGFKLTLGLPPDAKVELDRNELATIRAALDDLITGAGVTEAGAGPQAATADAPVELTPPGRGRPGRYEMDLTTALALALGQRLDLRVAIGKVYDTQRAVAVAADQLRADVTLLGRGSAGARRTLANVGLDDSILRPDEGVYSALLTVDLPLERTAERARYRGSLIQFEAAVREVQAVEDQIKLDVRNGLSRLLEARESVLIQAEAVRVAERRVASTSLFLEAGRAEIRDLLEAQDALVNAQNALTAAMISYRVNELALQRDLDVLAVDHRGLWEEYVPANGSEDHEKP